jgi:hypothetical protein
VLPGTCSAAPQTPSALAGDERVRVTVAAGVPPRYSKTSDLTLGAEGGCWKYHYVAKAN